ncbi:RtcB family protein [Algivirga pacifica]|uniref:3'-phosphate/5'-hydroxy nucleic acid ligase n=1 Tax=Algivirga pacifica TaxID=1162670 RepID=A0ABP9DA41_9BACT
MGHSKLKGKDLRKINYSSNQTISFALTLVKKHLKHASTEEQITLLKHIKNTPEKYLEDPIWQSLAKHFIEETPSLEEKEIVLRKQEEGAFNIFGRKHISSNAYQQMQLAMRLPIAERGALMPDAHQGYGLPIGGVLATQNSIIPYGVGVDIGCRMCLTLYNVPSNYMQRYQYQLQQALKNHTAFGMGEALDITQEHPILEDDRFRQDSMLWKLRDKAAEQLGSSGSGNHFVEFGQVKVTDGKLIGVPEGEYMGLLSHSGSRGLGATIAQYYTKLAMETTPLPSQVRHLAWLDLQSEAGQAYWLSMNLAGDYAKACHDQIHYHLSKALGLKALAKVENHHNFAWKEQQANGEELIVHRKGATPAGKGVLGIIPGSMTAAGYIVAGKGNEESLQSASHGAGRKMSRKNARETFTKSSIKKELSAQQVSLIGGGTDEAPGAYKDIEEIMSFQDSLVDIVGTFQPKVVRMDK